MDWPFFFDCKYPLIPARFHFRFRHTHRLDLALLTLRKPSSSGSKFPWICSKKLIQDRTCSIFLKAVISRAPIRVHTILIMVFTLVWCYVISPHAAHSVLIIVTLHFGSLVIYCSIVRLYSDFRSLLNSTHKSKHAVPGYFQVNMYTILVPFNGGTTCKI